MQKVYSVIKVQYANYERLIYKGIGYVCDNNLLIPGMSKKGSPYIRVFEDCIKYLRTKIENGRCGRLIEFHTHEIETKNYSGESTGIEKRESQTEYFIYIKKLK